MFSSTVSVKPDGTGDYTTLKAAVEAEGAGAAENNRILYNVYPGIYTDTEYFLPNNANIVGIGDLGDVWLKGELPDDADLNDIANTSTVWMNRTTKLKNLRVTCQNMRYPIHSDSSASTNQAVQEIEDCDVEHLGNDRARAYQISIGGDPLAVWPAEQAFGCGTHSDERIYGRRTRWSGKRDTFGFHSNKDFAQPAYVELDQCEVVTTVGGDALGVNNYGTGGGDQFVIKDCVINGTLRSLSGTWLSLELTNAIGKRTSETTITITGSSPVAWSSDDTGAVLELRSIDSAASAVAVSGTGADALFGVEPVIVPGGSGYAARAYSYHAIIGVSGTSLGARLGDCTGVNKVLDIEFDGSINVKLTFDQDYSAMDNATVVSALNTLLADGTRGFYVSTPYDEMAPVYQPEREVSIENTSSVVILKGMAVASGGRAATNADARQDIAGIALENIVPGAVGRVLFSGHVHKNAVLFHGSVSLTINDEFGVSGTAGKLVEGAAVPLLRYVATSVFEFV